MQIIRNRNNKERTGAGADNKDNKDDKADNKERNGAGAGRPSPRGGIWAGCQPWLSHQVSDHPQSESGSRSPSQ